MKMIVGLGNPGAEYKNTRHNAGFLVVEELARQLRVKKEKFIHNSIVAQAQFRSESVVIVKPLTYMNLSGRAVKQIINANHILLAETIVVMDDMDLEPGIIRLRARGGSGGQKGMQSIIDHLGTQDLARLRVGIGRPPGEDVVDWVLTRFSRDEQDLMQEAIQTACEALKIWLLFGIEKAMNQFN